MAAACYVRTCYEDATQVVEVIFAVPTEYGTQTDYKHVFMCEDHERGDETSVSVQNDGHTTEWFRTEALYSDLAGDESEVLEVTVSNIIR